MAEQHVGMAIRRFGVGRYDDVDAEVERALAVGRHRGVVRHYDRARGVRRGRDCGDVADIEARVGQGFQEDEPVAGETAIEIGRGRPQVERHAERFQEALGQQARRVVAVGRQQHAVACLQLAEEDCRNRCHAGREGDCLRVLEMRQQLFGRFPCRVVEAAIWLSPRARPEGGTSPPWSVAAEPDRPWRASARADGEARGARGRRAVSHGSSFSELERCGTLSCATAAAQGRKRRRIARRNNPSLGLMDDKTGCRQIGLAAGFGTV